jgi:tripartite-type tricarboxylate transporter receptor subunit TctC
MGNETRAKYLHIPYRGEAPAITALLQGDIDFIAVTTGPISPRVRAGEFRALAVTSTTRWRDFPDVPTIAERGCRDRSHLLDRARWPSKPAQTDRRQAKRRTAPRHRRARREEEA